MILAMELIKYRGMSLKVLEKENSHSLNLARIGSVINKSPYS